MFNIPHIPAWDAIHPLIIHFPIVLLLMVPFFIVLGFLWKKHRQCFFMISFIVLILGVLAAFVAVASGKAGAKLVKMNNPEISQNVEISNTLNRHQELGETTRTVFAILAVIYAGILFLPSLLKKELKPRLRLEMIAGFLIIYLICTLILANTADHGGRLVYHFGIHAQI